MPNGFIRPQWFKWVLAYKCKHLYYRIYFSIHHRSFKSKLFINSCMLRFNNLEQYDRQEWNYTKTKFPLNWNYDGKIELYTFFFTQCHFPFFQVSVPHRWLISSHTGIGKLFIWPLYWHGIFVNGCDNTNTIFQIIFRWYAFLLFWVYSVCYIWHTCFMHDDDIFNFFLEIVITEVVLIPSLTVNLHIRQI